jgi:AcrR family transcriptional regulator
MRLSSDTRSRIVGAGLELFYAASIAEVSVDAIAERAGVTKKTVYHHYPSKEALVAACYLARSKVVVEKYQTWASPPGDAAERIDRMFAAVRTYVEAPDFHGCAFLRAAAELASQRDHMAAGAISDYKATMEAWIAGLLASEGRTRAEGVARSIMMLLDGGLAHVMFHRDETYLDEARQAVATLLARVN